MGFFSRFFRPDQPESDTQASGKGDSAYTLDAASVQAVLAEIDIDTAISAHENWKIRLQNVLDGTSTERLEPQQVCKDDQCELGKWLHGPGKKRLGKYPAFSVLVARHQFFHVQASTVLALAQAGDKAKAVQVMSTTYRHGSNQVMILLRQLKHGLGR
ncbi:MAG: CZB domain-containing protein [Burkholderiaceae bacterium]